MKTRKPSKILVTALFALTALGVPTKNATLKEEMNTHPFARIFQMRNAFAVTALNPENMTLATTAGRADFARFLYFLVNGPTADYTISGPPAGLVGIITDITGPNALGRGLTSAGYATCANIPTTGTATAGDSSRSFAMTFSAGTKTIPAHFGTGAGQTFDKKISITMNGTPFMVFEAKCSAASTVQTGYLLMKPSGDRNFEAYFQKNSSTNAAYVDFFMTYAAQSENVATRFVTADGDSYQLWLTRTAGSGSVFFGLNGKKSTNLVKLNVIFDNAGTNTAAISTATYSDCLNMSTNTTGTGCESVTDPTAGPTIRGSSFGWTIGATSTLSLSDL